MVTTLYIIFSIYSQASVLKAARELVEFINRGPSPYHGMYVCIYCGLSLFSYTSTVVEECKRQLLEKDFVELKERESWNVKPGGRVCNTFEEDSSIYSFIYSSIHSYIHPSIHLHLSIHSFIFLSIILVFCDKQLLNYYCICCWRSV